MVTRSTDADARPAAGTGAAVPRAGGAGPPHRRLDADVLVVLVAAAIGVAHALVVGRTYHVGSFDDDASYLMTAKAIAHGVGLGGMLPAGYPLVATYPPGFALLLSPVAVVAGDTTWPYRALCLAFFALLFPLVDRWLAALRAPRWLRAGVLLLLALNPVAATYGTMIMAEAPFMVGTVGLFLLARRWSDGARTLSAAGVGVVVTAAALLWLKEAALGLVVGLAVWLLLRRQWRRAVAVVVGAGLLFTPVLALRAAAGTPLAGARYSTEIGGHAAIGAVPQALHYYLGTALPRSIVPLVDVPRGPFLAVYVTASTFVVVGAVVALVRWRGPATVMTLVYFAQTLVYPYINERRVVLVLPVVLAWYLLGAHACLRAAGALASRLRAGLPVQRSLATLGVALLVVPLGWQFGRNYRFDRGQETSRPLGSPYLRYAAAVTRPGDVIETDYLWTVSLGTDRRTSRDAFLAGCDPAAIRAAALADGAGYVVDGAFNRPPPADDCQGSVLDSAAWAVPLFRTPVDDAAVYLLRGPGTVHPRLRDAVTGTPATAVDGGAATATWTWRSPQPLTLLSLGRADAAAGAAGGVLLQWRDAQGRWHVAAGATGPVGPRATPFLLWRPDRPVSATGIRVAVAGGTGIVTADVHALTTGPS